jgi:uncharacterized SAM-binding protein YcdF (DUF218 family)
MLLVLSKVLVLLFYPLTLALALIITGLVVLHLRKKRAATVCIVGAVVLLWLFSSDPLSYWLVRSLERQYPPVTSFPQTSALVLLTGGETAKAPPRLFDEINEGGDRILYAGRLMAQNAAPRCNITGGTIDIIRRRRRLFACSPTAAGSTPRSCSLKTGRATPMKTASLLNECSTVSIFRPRSSS